MNAHNKGSRRYYERNKEKVNERNREYYRRNREKQLEQQRQRYIEKREAAYKWYYKIVTGYLPYEQGRKK